MAVPIFALLLLVVSLVFPLGQAFAEPVGSAVRVVQGATLERAGQAVTLRAGQSVESGDVITTDRRGQVQLLFNDQTRIAVGPNSLLTVDDIRFRQTGKARKFAVSAVAGGFRFLSGTSARSAYAINTPTATMGIRGTAFDFVVRESKGTDLVIFSGLVNMCGKGGCLAVTGGCDAVSLDPRGNFARIEQKKDKRNLLHDGFYFVTEQQRLRPDFRTKVRSCGRDVIEKRVSKAGDRTAPPKQNTGPAPH
ncbi:MAG TPA: FecR domain-containing protein [Albidovulum sp.]|uniref:FecR family protein n=1 Tax=Albidovulum sp. TaxID=1872424 RepID=UPI002CABE817|nr:FecR domain-containing protein [Albidovulum sp.]